MFWKYYDLVNGHGKWMKCKFGEKKKLEMAKTMRKMEVDIQTSYQGHSNIQAN